VDADEAQAVRAEGFDPDDPAVVAAMDRVRWDLSPLLGFQRWKVAPLGPVGPLVVDSPFMTENR
jgi:hypothetical protein